RFAKQVERSPYGMRFGGRWIHAAEGNVVSARCRGLLGPGERIVTGYADNPCQAEHDARLDHAGIVAPQMHTVGIDFGSELDIVIDDKQRPVPAAELANGPRLLLSSRLILGFVPVLDKGGTASEYRGYSLQQHFPVTDSRVGKYVKAGNTV